MFNLISGVALLKAPYDFADRFVSGYIGPMLAELARDAGVAEILKKPVRSP